MNLPPSYGYVVLTAIASTLMTSFLGFQVGSARKRFKVQYPTMYDDKQPVFNCYQRAHQNTLENYPQFLILLVFGGLSHPVAASVLGAIWIVSRFFYAYGYYTGEPKNRSRGFFGYIGLFGLIGLSAWTGISLLNGTL